MTYDSRGNCTYFGTYNFSYDAENRLVSAGSVSYTYDLLGRRISRTLGGSTTTYVWDGAHIIAEYTNGSLAKKYIYGPGMDNPIAMINISGQNEAWYYYYADALGSIRVLSDAGGSIVESYTYWTYGQPIVITSAGTDGNWLTEDGTTSNSSSYGNPYLFTGRRWDSTTGVYYYRFRDYTPLLGRFLQTDPAGYIDTMNLYAYCGNNPVNWIDPWGLDKGEPHKPSWIDRITDWFRGFRQRSLHDRAIGQGAPGDIAGQYSGAPLFPYPLPSPGGQMPSPWVQPPPGAHPGYNQYNPGTKESMWWDADPKGTHPEFPDGHWDYTDQDGNHWRVDPHTGHMYPKK